MIHWKKELYNTFLKEFPSYYKDSTADYFPSSSLPSKLTPDELEKLNEDINLPKLVGCQKHLVLHELLKDKSKDKFTFYLLNTLELNCDVNSYDRVKNTVFIEIAKRYFYSKEYFGKHNIMTLFKRGYEIKEEDEQFVLNLYKEKKKEEDFEKWAILRYATKLNDFDKLKIAFEKSRELSVILSFKMNRPVGFNFPNLLGVAVNAIIYYRENGDIILRSIDRFNQTEKIKQLDKRKNTFKRKRLEYIENKPLQNKEFEQIAIELFPELAKLD